MTAEENTTPTIQGYAAVNGAQIYYELAGAGPALVLVHAGVADSRMWDQQFQVFAQRYTVIRYDLRGYGKTAMPAGAFASHEDLAGLLSFLRVEKAHLVGLSYGGRIAINFTLTHPEMVATLVLGAPSVGGHPPSPDVQRCGAEEEAALERGDVAGATELNLRMWVDGPRRTPDQVDPVVRERVREMQFHAFTMPTPADAEERPLTPPAISRLGDIQVPTLVVVGDHDIPAQLALAERLAAEIRGARKIVVPGVAHMINMEAPALFNQLVLDFLSAW
jgi:pimeloyl-ACP methyl ester carboxylesterase